jgi:maltoporin
MGLSALLVTSVLSADAVAQEPGESNAQQGQEADATNNTEEPKQAAQPPAVLEPGAGKVPIVPNVAPRTGPPKAGDLSVSGYFRGGFGGIIQQTAGDTKVGGRMTCFSVSNPAGLVAKYRLGNECEVWSETHFTFVTYADDDGVVSRLHFMPTVFIPTTTIGYSPNGTVNSPAIFTTSTGATVSFPNLYVDIAGIPWLHGGTAWAGTRYYKRESVYINDFFYWNPSGVGAGVEDVHVGDDLRISLGLFAVDGEPAQSSTSSDPSLPLPVDFGVRADLQVRGIKLWPGGEIQIGLQGIADYSNHPRLDTNGDPMRDASGNVETVTHSGWGATVQWVQQVLGGDNKLALQYGKGGGTGFGTLSRFYYPDFSLYFDPSEYRMRGLDVLTVQPFEWLGAQADFIYQHDQNFLGVKDANTDWYSAGGRVGWSFARHAKLLAEVGYDRITKSNGSKPQQLTKLTIAPALTAGRGLLSRPELRAFFTYAFWNETARGAGIDSGNVYRSTQFLRGMTAGIQAETWF